MSPSTKKALSLIPMVITAALIAYFGITRQQQPLDMFPLFVSLMIGYLQMSINRYACLLGSINSIIYAYIYFHFDIPANAASALFISCPIQMITFIRWSKHPYRNSTMLRKLTGKQRLYVFGGTAVAAVILQMILSAIGSSYRLLDNIGTLLGIVIYFLTMFSFIEYLWLMLPCGLLSISLNFAMMQDYPERITYLIYSIYSFFCILRGFFHARKLYAEQQEMMKRSGNSELTNPVQ